MIFIMKCRIKRANDKLYYTHAQVPFDKLLITSTFLTADGLLNDMIICHAKCLFCTLSIIFFSFYFTVIKLYFI